MRNRVISFVLTLLMVLACVPATALTATAEGVKPTIYVMNDVYGKPGETVTVNVGFKNTAEKNIQQFQAVLSAGDAAIVNTQAIPITPTPTGGGAGVVNSNGNFGYACGLGSFGEDSYVSIQVIIPESAKDGDVYDLTVSKSANFEEVMCWEGGESLNGNVSFEGAKLYVSRYEPVEVSVMNTVAEIGQSQIRVPVLMSATDGKLASCSGLTFGIAGSATEKVSINTYACKEYKIMGANENYTVVLPDARSFSLGFASGFENAIIPSGDDFRIFELVFDVLEPLSEEDVFTITPSGVNCFKAYGEDGTETVTLYVSKYNAGTVSAELPYEWTVLDEDAGTARLDLYTGNSTDVVIPDTVIGNGTVGTAGKEYTVVELYGNNEDYEGVFYGNETVVSIRIPESVKKIDEYAISECPDLTKLTVMSPDLEIVENDGDTFLHYFFNKKIGYILPENLVIHSYESATIKTWADDNEATFDNLIKLVGEQKGEEGIRFIGGVSDLEYKSIDFIITVPEANKQFSKSATSVYKTLKGKVNGVHTPVVTTVSSVAEETGAHLISEFAYLYGYAISGVPATGSFTFEVTPSAVTAGGVTVYGKTVNVLYQNGEIINN